MPIEYVVEKGKKPVVHVPIQILNKPDILDQAMSEKANVPHEYRTYVHGEHSKEKILLTSHCG